MGGCVGCSVALTFAAEYPGAAASMVLYSPAGGPRYRVRQQERFARHLAYALEHGPSGVAALARDTGAGFTEDPRVGPWAPGPRSSAPTRRSPSGMRRRTRTATPRWWPARRAPCSAGTRSPARSPKISFLLMFRR